MLDINDTRNGLLLEVANSVSPRSILKSQGLRQLYETIKTLPVEERVDFGKKVNELKNELEEAVVKREQELEDNTVDAIDVTAPFDVNSINLDLLATKIGTQHPLTLELEKENVRL